MNFHPAIKNFWEQQGWINLCRSGTHSYFIVAEKENDPSITRIVGYDGREIMYYYLTEGGPSYLEEEMLRLIKLKAFL